MNYVGILAGICAIVFWFVRLPYWNLVVSLCLVFMTFLLVLTTLFMKKTAKIQEHTEDKSSVDLFRELFVSSQTLREDAENLAMVSKQMSQMSDLTTERVKKISELIQSLTAALEETSSGASEIANFARLIGQNSE
ncbi:MAG TPA: hypothetical protein PLD34_00150, partial [Pseudothermotoga sp.]|nr:hypothetical protein [Pseudothermotoga sp.]